MTDEELVAGNVNPSHWDYKEEWHRLGAGFRVVVKRHQTESYRPANDGRQRWAVYAYIYPSHPIFSLFDGDDLFQMAANELPLHCGASYLHWHCDTDGQRTSVQIGSDYDHLYDERFSHYRTKEEASEVFHDAKRLYEYLDAKEKEMKIDAD